MFIVKTRFVLLQNILYKTKESYFIEVSSMIRSAIVPLHFGPKNDRAWRPASVASWVGWRQKHDGAPEVFGHCTVLMYRLIRAFLR